MESWKLDVVIAVSLASILAILLNMYPSLSWEIHRGLILLIILVFLAELVNYFLKSRRKDSTKSFRKREY